MRHAIDYSGKMRRRIGVGGESEWLGGRGCQRLRVEFGKNRTEIEGVLEHYAKAMKWGKGREFNVGEVV